MFLLLFFFSFFMFLLLLRFFHFLNHSCSFWCSTCTGKLHFVCCSQVGKFHFVKVNFIFFFIPFAFFG